MMEQPAPVSVEAEQALLGSILMNDELLAQADLTLRDFSLDSHQRIWKCMQELAKKSHPIDFLTVTQWLQDQKQLDAVGGAAYVASLTEGLPRRSHIAEYVRIVKNKAVLRRVMQLGEQAIHRAADSAEDPLDLLADVQAQWSQLAADAAPSTLEPIARYFARAYKKVDDYVKRNARETGVMTGFEKFDYLTCGLQRKDLIVVAARPSMGKTAWAVNVADFAAVQSHKAVVFFSLEMSKEALLDRMCCSRAGVSLWEHRAGELSMFASNYFTEALGQILSETLLLLDDAPAQSVAEMTAKSLLVKQQYGLDLVIVDQLSFIAAGRSASKDENREQQVAGIMRSLKAMAKTLDVPVVVLAHLGRDLVKRADKRPILSDLRESGSIEQDADVVVFLHRPSYYEPTDNPRLAELIVAKQRQGPLGTANIFFQEHCTRFVNADPEKGA